MEKISAEPLENTLIPSGLLIPSTEIKIEDAQREICAVFDGVYLTFKGRDVVVKLVCCRPLICYSPEVTDCSL